MLSIASSALGQFVLRCTFPSISTPHLELFADSVTIPCKYEVFTSFITKLSRLNKLYNFFVSLNHPSYLFLFLFSPVLLSLSSLTSSSLCMFHVLLHYILKYPVRASFLTPHSAATTDVRLTACFIRLRPTIFFVSSVVVSEFSPNVLHWYIAKIQ